MLGASVKFKGGGHPEIRAVRASDSRLVARSFEPPLTPAAIESWAHVLMPEITVSGSIPQGPTTRSVTYFVVDTARNAIAGNLTLPDAADFARSFQMNVRVVELSENYDVGTFADDGEFVSAGFKVEAPQPSAGAIGPRT